MSVNVIKIIIICISNNLVIAIVDETKICHKQGFIHSIIIPFYFTGKSSKLFSKFIIVSRALCDFENKTLSLAFGWRSLAWLILTWITWMIRGGKKLLSACFAMHAKWIIISTTFFLEALLCWVLNFVGSYMVPELFGKFYFIRFLFCEGQ